ncbi:MAG: heat-inducible transcriptional repressor HrcA [Mycoplasmatales bacterium]|nr:heat-inducible transcriptional repressor HrcA [Mycoplasmatales bacterium]
MTKRQQELLKLIVETYIHNGEPVGSKTLIKKSGLSLSSATVRNEMAVLEKEGYLEKAHTSSGRIPSIKGYKYYATFQAKKENETLANKLKDIFARRRVSIDITLDEAVSAISEIAGLTIVTSSTEADELMKSIQLTPINDKMATIVIVTSSGRVESKIIEFNDRVKVDDVRIAVRLFKERLIDTKLIDLPIKVEALAPILSSNVKNYEAIIQAFVGKVFDFHSKIINRQYGTSALIKRQEIKRKDLANLVDLITNRSVWEAIESDADDEETLKIEIRPNNTSLISKKIKVDNNTKEIAFVGSNRMDYAEAKQAIHLLEKFLKGGK